MQSSGLTRDARDPGHLENCSLTSSGRETHEHSNRWCRLIKRLGTPRPVEAPVAATTTDGHEAGHVPQSWDLSPPPSEGLKVRARQKNPNDHTCNVTDTSMSRPQYGVADATRRLSSVEHNAVSSSRVFFFKCSPLRATPSTGGPCSTSWLRERRPLSRTW